MSKEIKVVYADILKASGTFKDSGKKYADIVPRDIGTVPRVTEGSLEKAISAVLEAIEVMHDALGSSMQTHGDKLKYVHDTYRNTEDDINDLLGKIDDPEGIQPRF
ncbi:hypothetical protein E1264_33150 [Actinomadura sp. KC216]|uniref:DUF6317 family protein n=1 Tax=Actinomadura sp. KC216 TaxID=2530370 RepID=UPI001048A77A|nr:DUF6317 family protein [Actinomadura sp. KC216]TDB81138.1 hypothetical protein E1264_33150 [Actinomadura sp. KC216]